ncbi:MAG: hypothetical protein A3A94_01900 [Candidatus Portnoybacteria bacterium RIFCSPLOWO2_01_FULL_43_11]|uniref:RNA polymerase sigma-70 domain-containing protein n=2 Tax=Bacteria candidate phyla TaxID=1783234 RepID=A0A1G2FLX7_9BACT|nr:MAG: hypothetical protein A2713_01045 [candidate division WWE3 bacterium RIFCSPHIGHO2_01_FULL_35_17]OGZ36532.1 MAG: hypothetical protein A3D38_01025 [Candidatus Portnoybacteria bacterium RIFCSPHIGHO2_02_FULL_40_23]OGZ39056.1 MAG: hypothetical protein A3A94_01900 [Candidatus Portnoybacteria bacterium RIFCSPLOWO2_01_FULL_43_11]
MPEKIKNSFESTPRKPNEEKPDKTSELFPLLKERIYFLYRREIGEFPLLTQAEEKSLGEKIKAVREEIEKEEGKQNPEIIEQGNEAVNKLVCANLRLVLSVINKEFREYQEQQLDLIQTGNMALISAAKNFDINEGVKFSSYASKCIRNKIKTTVTEKQGLIKISHYLFPIFNIYKEEEKNLRKELEIEDSLSLTEKEEKLLIQRIHNSLIESYETKISQESIREIPQYFTLLKEPISLGQKTRRGERGVSLEEGLADTEHSYAQDPEKRLIEEKEVAKEIIDKILLVAELGSDRKLNLSNEDMEIIRMRFGIDYPEEHTLKEIGKKFKVSREAIRQREERILEKMRKLLEQTGQFDKIKEEIE